MIDMPTRAAAPKEAEQPLPKAQFDDIELPPARPRQRRPEEVMIAKPTKVSGPTKEVKKPSDVSPQTSPRERLRGQTSAVPKKRVVFDPDDL